MQNDVRRDNVNRGFAIINVVKHDLGENLNCLCPELRQFSSCKPLFSIKLYGIYFQFGVSRPVIVMVDNCQILASEEMNNARKICSHFV